MEADLTHAAASEAFAALSKTFTAKCDIYVALSLPSEVGSLRASVYPQSIVGKVLLTARGDTYRELIADCEERWAIHSDLHASTTIREMALSIIAITADQGECSDAALRAKFDAADVDRYGDHACAEASSMASNGPFSIVKLSGANDQVAA